MISYRHYRTRIYRFSLRAQRITSWTWNNTSSCVLNVSLLIIHLAIYIYIYIYIVTSRMLGCSSRTDSRQQNQASWLHRGYNCRWKRLLWAALARECPFILVIVALWSRSKWVEFSCDFVFRERPAQGNLAPLGLWERCCRSRCPAVLGAATTATTTSAAPASQ